MLPSTCELRPAIAQDLKPIRRLVWGAWLDPTQLRWQQFWVVQAQETVIACGQLRTFAGAQELGSLVVAQPWRHQGIGSHMARFLTAQAEQPLYLECLGVDRTAFYQTLGFESVPWSELPRSLQGKFAPTALGRWLGLPMDMMQYRVEGDD